MMGAHLPLLLTGLSGRLLTQGSCLDYVRCPLLLSPDHQSALLDEDLESRCESYAAVSGTLPLGMASLA